MIGKKLNAEPVKDNFLGFCEYVRIKYGGLDKRV